MVFLTMEVAIFYALRMCQKDWLHKICKTTIWLRVILAKKIYARDISIRTFLPIFFYTDMSACACMSACMFIEKINKFGIEKKDS